MGKGADRVREWVRRYLLAELGGLTAALAASIAVAAWLPGHLVVLAYAATVAEGVGFYGTFLAIRYLREDIAGPPVRKWGVLVAAAAVEFGPAEVLDTLVVRPAAVLLGTIGTGHPIVGVLIGKVAADVVFYALAIVSYETLVRRLLARLRRSATVGSVTAPRKDF